ncbi:MAG: glycosyltransferase [Lachnospiraceae bacterium]|nr:glycosyltransferase [Lachnospiraceae bacterium]
MDKITIIVPVYNEQESLQACEPVAEIRPARKVPVSNRIGVGKGKFKAPEDFDANNEEAYSMLSGGFL